jgi:hypothetical protein
MVEGTHLHDELAKNPARVTVQTAFGPVVGGRATSGSVIFLGKAVLVSSAVLSDAAMQKFRLLCLQEDSKILFHCLGVIGMKGRSISRRQSVSFLGRKIWLQTR